MEKGCLCENCGIRYKVDILIPDDLWEKITGKVGKGLLCGRCIMEAIEGLGRYFAFSLVSPEYTEKIIEGIREKMEKGKLGLNPSSFEEDMEKTADMESYNQGIDSCLALLSSLRIKR